MSSTATKDKPDETKTDKPKAEKSEHLKELEKQLADLDDADDGVDAEEVPADTAAELERVKQVIGHQFGIDMRSPGQVKQAEIDGLEAEIQLQKEQDAEAAQAEKEAAEAAKAEEEAKATAGSSKK